MTTSITLRILLLNIVDSLSNYYDTLFRKLQAPAIKSSKYKIKTNEKGMSQGRSYSEQIAAQIDEEVRRIIASAYNQCEEILRARRPQLESVANYLLAHETMNRSEFLTVVDVPAPAQA